MKKYICLLISVAVVLSLCGCQLLNNTVQAPDMANPDAEEPIRPENSGIVVDIGGFGNPDSNDAKDEVEPPEPEKPKPVPVQIESSDIDFSKIKQISGNIEKKIKLYGDLNESEELVELAEILGGYEKNISFAAMSLKDNKAIAYNTKQGYFSACTIKIAYILSCCKQIDKGAADKETLLTYKKKHYHKGSGHIQDEEFGTQYTIEYLIKQSLYISDNVAYAMLIDYFGFDYYNKMITELGCNSLRLHDMWARSAMVKDFVILWNEIYNYFQSETEMAEFMKAACTNTPYNYGTRTLGVSYSHKSGDNYGQSAAYNDAGIVWGDSPYIYVVFTNSEGKKKDEKIVDRSMELIYELFRK